MTKRKKRAAVRNPLYQHPLLGKGGVHSKTRKALRRRDKLALRKEWCDPMASSVMGSHHSVLHPFGASVANAPLFKIAPAILSLRSSRLSQD